jgi:pathogenesis-related protein 1
MFAGLAEYGERSSLLGRFRTSKHTRLLDQGALMALPHRHRCLSLSLVVGSLGLFAVGFAGCEGTDSVRSAQPTAGTSSAVQSAGGDASDGGSPSDVGGSSGDPTTAGGASNPSDGGAAQGGAATGGATGATGTLSSTAQQFVDAHNAVRAAVTQPTNYSGTWAPIPPVNWSDTVAASAQTWAGNLAATQNCNLVHESQSTYGENLAMGTRLTPQGAVDLWAGEKSKYTYSPTYTIADFNAGSGHYTQVVWRKTTQIGCGSATCGTSVVISCRYLPPGNVIGGTSSVY